MDQEKITVINKAIQTLNNGGVILYPTDTIWGIGCDPTNEKAILKIYKIKKRASNKPLILLTHDAKMIKKYIKFLPEKISEIIKNQIRPTSIIYNNPINLPEILIHNNTIAIRVVKNHDINILLKYFNKPITSTSANITNSKTPINFSEIDDQIKNNVDYIVPNDFSQTVNGEMKSSRVIKITNNSKIQIIRD